MVSSGGAFAAEAEGEGEGLPLWEMRLAGFAQYAPAYPASDENTLSAIPFPFPVYRGKVFRFGEDMESLGRGRLLQSDRVKLDVNFDVSFPADSDDIDAREGMPDLDWLLEAGPELEFGLADGVLGGGRLLLGLQLRGAVSADGLSTSYRGLVFNPELKYRNNQVFGPRTEFSVRVTPAFATSEYMNYFYEVEPRFATPTRPAFEADAGYLGTELTTTIQRHLNERLELRAGVKVWLNHGATNDDSPLFREDVNYGVFAALIWSFWHSAAREPQVE